MPYPRDLNPKLADVQHAEAARARDPSSASSCRSLSTRSSGWSPAGASFWLRVKKMGLLLVPLVTIDDLDEAKTPCFCCGLRLSAG